MAHILADLVLETTTTTGNGSLTLSGAIFGYRTFSSTVGEGNTCHYALESSDGQKETGLGTVVGSTLERTTLIASSTGAKLVLPAGTHRVGVSLNSASILSSVSNDPAPVLGGALQTDGNHVLIQDATQTQKGMMGYSVDFSGVFLADNATGTYDPAEAALLLRSGRVELRGGVVQALPLSGPSAAQVYADPEGVLYTVAPPSTGWDETDTDNGVYATGTGTGLGAWVKLTGLSITTPEDVAVSGRVDGSIRVWLVNGTTQTGEIEVSFGVDNAEPTIAGDNFSVAASQVGWANFAVSSTAFGALPAGTVIHAWVRRVSGSHTSFGVSFTGTTNNHSMLVSVPAEGSATAPILTIADTNTVDLVLTGSELSANARLQMSVTSDASGIRLTNDQTSPGNGKVYGTNNTGVKGWMSVQQSISFDAGGFKLVGDAASPGNNYLYGTDGAGAKGYRPVSGLSVTASQISDSGATGRALVQAATAAAAQQAMNTEVGVDVQAYSANLAEYAAVNPTTQGLALLDAVDAEAQRITLADRAWLHQSWWESGDIIGLNIVSTGVTAGSVTAGQYRAWPWLITRTTTIDRILTEVTVAGGAGAKFRFGIYTDNNRYPGTLVANSDAGEFAADSVGVQTADFASPITLTPGLYWVVTTGDGTPTIRCLPATACGAVLGFSPTLGGAPAYVMWIATAVYGPMPATYPVGAIKGQSAFVTPWFRVQ